MDVEFTTRGTGVGPGRKRLKAPDELLDILRATYEHGTQAELDVRAASSAEINEVSTLIKNGARELGKVGRVFGARAGVTLRFWMEDE